MNSKIFIVIGVILFLLIPFALSFESKDSEYQERLLSRQKKALLFPTSTTWQLTMALVSQISYVTTHRVSLNTGFNMAYNLPSSLSQFYSPIYWARSFVNNNSSMLSSFVNKLAMEPSSEESSNEITEQPEYDGEDTTVSPRTKRDVTAGEFYGRIKEVLSLAGYHESCLLKSVCELSRHPLIENDDNLIHDIINFILTPSIHQSFDPNGDENEEKEMFEKAEELGKLGADCNLYYEKCKTSPLHAISNFIENHE